MFLIFGMVFMVSGIPNPAPIYCENMGYTYNDTDCIFDDGSFCELWSFYNGDCGSDKVDELDCLEKGEGMSPGYECCEGLVSKNPKTLVIDGVCDQIAGSFGICIACGDGVCEEEYENICNCPEDCSESEDGDSEVSGQKKEDGSEDNGIGQTIRNRVHSGVYTNENGEQIRVSEMAQNRFKLESGGVEAECECELEEEEIQQNRTRLKVRMSNGKNSEVKVMPDVASENALEKLRMNNCLSEEGCEIELKEVGSGESAKLAYEVRAKKQGRFLGLFKVRMNVEAQVDAENGEVIRTKKPWWAFLVNE